MSTSTTALAVRRRLGSWYPWAVVILLWFSGFFNYADRQSVFGVFPHLQKEFHLNKEQLGWIGSSFMLVYAPASLFAGYIVDRFSRRGLITSGLVIWSVICALTGTARSYRGLLFYRVSEGLGESIYFPASMSLIADYHGPRTRSRAMGIHQTCVYLGIAGGAVVSSHLAEWYGWRTPFWALGLTGMVYAVLLLYLVAEPLRGGVGEAAASADPDLSPHTEHQAPPKVEPAPFWETLWLIVRIPPALFLLLAFISTIFVSSSFMSWVQTLIYEKFGRDNRLASWLWTAWPLASFVGALCGGVMADWAARWPGGRMLVQGLILFVAAPLVFLVGWAGTIPILVFALIGVGWCKGVHDANIFATLYDVVPTRVRGTAAGLMNTVGWSGGACAPIVIGTAQHRYGLSLSQAISATSSAYVLSGILIVSAALLTARRARAKAQQSLVHG